MGQGPIDIPLRAAAPDHRNCHRFLSDVIDFTHADRLAGGALQNETVRRRVRASSAD